MAAVFDSPSSHRDLVVIAPEFHDAHLHRPVLGTATFLTHLIATARQLPQARARRRAEPSDAIAAYQATVDNLHRFDKP
jgi:hypothetical protein